MDRDRFEYEMKKAGYKTPESRAEAWNLSISAYYRRISGECECTKSEIERIADLLGWEIAGAIFFSIKVS